jgi:hypothetical protein
MANRAKSLSLKSGQEFLRGALIDVEEQFCQDLRTRARSITHDGTLGDAVEDAWIALLGDYLPARYRVAKAFAIDHEGRTTDQLDCLIYDAHFTPALFGKDRHLYVPAEAVYATFEIKPTVNATYLKAAAKKGASLRALARTSAPIPWANGVNPARKPFPILTGLLALEASWKDGLGSAFEQQLQRWTGTNEIDMVLTGTAGFCDRFTGEKRPTIASGPGSLIRGLFRLLMALRHKASVVAVDWNAYEAVLLQPGATARPGGSGRPEIATPAARRRG